MDGVKLIECVRARPALYNKKDKRYSNREFVQQMLEQVASELEERAEIVKKKWSYLRDYYRKQKKYLTNTKSGQAADRKKKWPLFDTMSFLDPFTECPETVSNFDDSQQSQATTEDDNTHRSTPSPNVQRSENPQWPPSPIESQGQQQDAGARLGSSTSKPAYGKRKRRDTNFDMQILEVLKESEKDEDTDGHMAFWKSIEPMLRQLQPLEVMRFRHEVQGLVISYVERANAPNNIVNPTASYPTNAGNNSNFIVPGVSPSPSIASSHSGYEQYPPSSRYDDAYNRPTY